MASKVTDFILEDATKDLILEVSPEDIKRSTTKDPSRCVFATCAVRQLNADEAIVFRTRAYIRKGKVWKRYIVSEAIARELVIFDRGGRPEGGKFLLKRPYPSGLLGNPKQGTGAKKYQKKPSQGRRVVFHRVSDVRIEGSRGLLLMERLGV
jgi:hypothetical protein